MGNSYSVLQKLTRADIRHAPFPHLVVEDCLPSDLYAQLSSAYPDDRTVLELGEAPRSVRANSRHDIGAFRLLRSDRVSPLWQAFVAHHVSGVFFQQFASLMGAEIARAYPWLEERLGAKPSEWTTALRYDPAGRGQIALDCHVGINTPAARSSSVRRVHTDAPDELFAMLLYFRREDDESQGGDLELLRWKDGRDKLFVGSEVDERDVECVQSVLYRPNTLVAFLNTVDSLHAVSRRSPSPVSRRLVNIMGRLPHSVPEGLFAKRQKRDPLSTLRRAVQRAQKAAGTFSGGY